MNHRLSGSIIFVLIFLSLFASGQQQLNGTVSDSQSGETIVGAVITQKGTSNGTTTDIDGRFSLSLTGQPPYTITVNVVGFSSQEIIVADPSKQLSFKLIPKKVELKGVEVTGSRISEKQKQAPLTVESMDRISIKEAAQISFYEALATMKGVDQTSASLGFTIINTRGFNSTSPVRTLQLIDGVDNQSPGLNFSLGNFLGASELDVLKVDLIAGASSAFYGPNAFNGVISMTSRSPFVKPGLEVTAKVGERNLRETALRWAQVFKNKSGAEKFGYKLNLFYMQARDWEAGNAAPTPQSLDGIRNPGGYDAVNRYGDEYNTSMDFTGGNNPALTRYPGLARFYRTGYWERDLVDYDSRNLKAGVAFHYNLTDSISIILASNFGTGTTVYQGDNRYSLKDVLFFQNRFEISKPGKFFLRAYATNEDAGKSYDAYFTAILLQNSVKDDALWARDYYTRYIQKYSPRVRQFPDLPNQADYADYPTYLAAINPFLIEHYYDSLVLFHNETRAFADNIGYLAPGSVSFDTAFQSIISRKSFSEGGSRFYDKSALYHVQGEYRFPFSFLDLTLGGNGRLYRPNSQGTIFADTNGRVIRNSEYGFYAGLEKTVLQKVKLNLTSRVDKNENFDFIFSPALSAVYNFKPNQIFRVSFSAAVRNPTLADQYLYYNVGRAILLGNTTGYDSLVTTTSLLNALISGSPLEYFNIKKIAPERVRTIEAGYRGTIAKDVFVDVVAYASRYNSFIGYKIGADVTYLQSFQRIIVNNIYRIASNSDEVVYTYGFSGGVNYYLSQMISINGNYSYNKLDKKSTDPLIPAFNTPLHKYNLGIAGRDVSFILFKKIRFNNYGFSVNYRWVEGFQFEGSPQFTGYVPQYDFVDAQVSKRIPKIRSTFKLGASNVLDKRRFTVYGGPTTGRLAYISVLVELN
jgi:iron complex outermembrane recepter protein